MAAERQRDPAPVVAPVRFAETVDRLIARNCHAIDGADHAGYGATYTDGAVFDNEATGTALHGREEIVASAIQHRAKREAARVIARHYVLGTVVDPHPDGGSLASSTTLIVHTDRNGAYPFALLSCQDHVVVDDGVPRIKRRQVRPLADVTTGSHQDGDQE